jgi:hypothetical protein
MEQLDAVLRGQVGRAGPGDGVAGHLGLGVGDDDAALLEVFDRRVGDIDEVCAERSIGDVDGDAALVAKAGITLADAR